MLKFSFYKAPITNTVPFLDYSIKSAIDAIKSDKYKDVIERLRKSDNKSVQEALKKSLDYFTFSGRFKRRVTDALIEHSGIICLDFDGLTKKKIKELVKQLREVSIVLGFFISPGGFGIKVLVKIQGQKHLESYHSLKAFFNDNFEIEADKGVNDFTRACFVSWDPDAYLNEDSELWIVPEGFTIEEEKKKTEKEKAKPKRTPASKRHEIANNLERVRYCVDQIESRNIDITENDYDDRLMVGFALSTLGEEARDLYHRAVQYNDAYTEEDANYKFDDALKNTRFTTPAKFFNLCKNHGINIKKPRTIDEAKELAELVDILGDESKAKDVHKYGLWEESGIYKSINLKGKHVEVSNFKMKILYHVATSEEEAYRMIQIKNIFGLDTVIKINTDDFVSAGTFKKVIARKGNFLWMGQDFDLVRLQDKLQREERPTTLVKTLGYNKRGNFYAWANGLYDADKNKFLEIDEYGIVEHQYKGKPQNYFIPAMSKIFEEMDDMYSNDKKFKLVRSNVAFKEWAALFGQVFGHNGRIGIIYYISALFSDIIFKDIGQRFPMLFAYGKRGSGKGTMIQSLMGLFGESQGQIMLGGATTVVGFMRKLAQYCNALVWLDEYKNNLHTKVVESIKNVYDRTGYERGRKDNSFQTESTPIRSAVIVSGQEMPTIEPALFSRVIQICFSETKRSEKARNLYRKLIRMEQLGLSHITVDMLRFRPLFAEKYEETYEATLREFSDLINNKEVEERMMQNYAVLITTMVMVHKELELPFTLDEFKKQCKDLLMEQFHVLKGSDDASKFWQIVEQLASSGMITEDKHYRLQNGYIDIRVQDVYQHYAETMMKRRDPNILDKSTLDSYLMSDTKSFVKRHKPFFGGTQKWCLQFKYIELEIDLIIAGTPEELKSKYEGMGLEFKNEEKEEEVDEFKKAVEDKKKRDEQGKLDLGDDEEKLKGW